MNKQEVIDGNKTIQIGFNPLRPSIAIQLKEQGFKFNEDEAEEFEDCRIAIFNLSINSLLTDKQESQVKQKLFNRIKAHVKKANKMKNAILKTQPK